MSFHWLGTFRQGSWQAYRRFVLEERRDVAERMAVIRAELTRIGEVTVIYASRVDDEGNVVVTENREGFVVTPGSSLAKMIQAYIAQGGNPFDISLFLTPDTTVVLDTTDPDQVGTDTLPHGGVVYPKSGAYVPGERYEGGFLEINKYIPARVGGRVDLQDSQTAGRVDAGRRWLQKEIRGKRDELEYRILKLADLREQLLQELDDILAAVAGVVPEAPNLDEDRFDKELSVAHVVAAIDSVFYDTDETNTPDFTTENTTRLGDYPHLLSDLDGEENTAL